TEGSREYRFHGQTCAAAMAASKLVTAVSPNGMSNTAIGDETFIVTLLIPVVYAVARKHAVAVVLVGTGGGHPCVRRAPSNSSVLRLREISVGLEALAGRVIPGVVERYIHVTSDGIDGEPMIKTVNRKSELVGNGFG